MKQKDILVIAAIVIASAVIAAVVSNLVFKPGNRQEKVEVVQPISADFPEADSRFFNKRAVDPTQTIEIGEGSNADPFKGAGH